LLADHPSAGLETMADLAERAGVSPPLVMRFAQGLGPDEFTAVQSALREVLVLLTVVLVSDNATQICSSASTSRCRSGSRKQFSAIEGVLSWH
jgi:DNA-binding MurR/RpiR family transcriptional regulator